jgi:hypothetical protein
MEDRIEKACGFGFNTCLTGLFSPILSFIGIESLFYSFFAKKVTGLGFRS